ncbi:hemerythrin-like domain-containing protein [Bradyrhizobium sp. LM2.7]
MIIERLSQEHLNIEKLLAILERELEVFDRGDRADYEVIHARLSVISKSTQKFIIIPRKTWYLPS